MRSSQRRVGAPDLSCAGDVEAVGTDLRDEL